MSDDEADLELLELLRQSLGISKKTSDEVPSDTGVLRDAEHIYANAIDVSIDMFGTKAAAASLYNTMQQRGYSTQAWSEHDLHPTPDQGFSVVDIVNFVFAMDLLNFSFWSELPENERYQVEYQGKRWTGYKSLVACLRRALDEGIPITTPRYWNDRECTNDVLRHIFRSATDEQIPLLDERIAMLRGAGDILHENFGRPDDGVQTNSGNEDNGDSNVPVETLPPGGGDAGTATLESVTVEGAEQADPGFAPPTVTSELEAEDVAKIEPSKASGHPDLTVVRLIEKADHSAGKLVNLLAKHFPSFRDEARFDGKRVRILKRAQIFVADLWAAFNGTSYGDFTDIDHLTMFADYRVPQMLRSLGVLVYSPPLHYHISSLKEIPASHSWEIQLRGCSIWAVELVRREILAQHPEATGVNAVLIDFLLYDLAKEREAAGSATAAFHRTRGTAY